MKSDKAIESFDAHLEDSLRIAAELLTVLVHRVGWTDEEIDWTKVKPMMLIHDQLEQVQQIVEAATGNRRPGPLAAERKIKPAPGTLVEEPPPVSHRWFSEPTREDS